MFNIRILFACNAMNDLMSAQKNKTEQQQQINQMRNDCESNAVVLGQAQAHQKNE